VIDDVVLPGGPEWTPTTEDVRGAWHAWSDGQGDSHADKPTWSYEEFDRWIAAHDAEIRAEVKEAE